MIHRKFPLATVTSKHQLGQCGWFCLKEQQKLEEWRWQKSQVASLVLRFIFFTDCLVRLQHQKLLGLVLV